MCLSCLICAFLIVSDKETVAVTSHGAVLVIGAEAKGRGAAGDGLITVRVGNSLRTFRPLSVGDLVEKDEVIGCLLDQDYRQALTVEKKKATELEAELNDVRKGVAEAKARYELGVKLLQSRACISADDVLEKKLLFEMFAAEGSYKKANLDYVQFKIKRLQDLEKYVDKRMIQSPVRGVIHSIQKHAGDAVTRSETVLTIRVTQK